MGKIHTWKDVYKLPLEYDGYNYVFTKTGVTAITFQFGMNEDDKSKIVNAINGTENHTIVGLRYNGCDFYQDDTFIFCVRGWGHLTGCGALNLKERKAIKVQDGFIKYIYDKLTIK